MTDKDENSMLQNFLPKPIETKTKANQLKITVSTEFKGTHYP